MKHSTLIDLLRQRALHQPERRAYTFLGDEEGEGLNLTYAELDRQARAIGAVLQSRARTGERALLLYPPGLEFIAAFFGCQYSGIIAVPAPPPKHHKTLTRLQTIARDARPSVVLTTSPILSTVDKLLDQSPELQDLPWLATDKLAGAIGEEWRDPEVSDSHLSFLQYTSGSTAEPKGVMVSHNNIMSNSAELDLGWRHDQDSVVVTWLPHFHDMGLIYGIIQPLYKGFRCYLMPPMHFLQRPVRWLKAMTRYQGTHSAAPNFAYDLCVQKVTSEQKARLDLSSWHVAINGAEPIRKETLERFARAFEPCGFRRSAFCPGYGLAEATLKVTSSERADHPLYQTVRAAALEQNRIVTESEHNDHTRTLVSCGHPILETKVLIVDPQTARRRARGEVGEVWVSGPSVAQGYWNRSQETRQTFQAYLADTGEGPFLRTGDLGFVDHGELFVTGRIKDLIIIGGHNHYPQDIERTVEQSHPALRPGCSAAFAIDVDGDERLVVLAEVDRRYRPERRHLSGGLKTDEVSRTLDSQDLIKAIRRAVAEEHELQVSAVSLLKAGCILKTSSGKVQRHACRAGFLDRTLEIWGEGDPAPACESPLLSPSAR